MSASEMSRSHDRQNSNPYRYTAGFIRAYWAWAYLRRNPRYRLAYAKHRDDAAKAAEWSLVRFEDPDTDGRSANVFWRREDCRHVLPLTASAKNASGEGHYFSLAGLRCRVTIHHEADRFHILFAENGRSLQLEISGAFDPENSVLFTRVLPPPRLRAARLLAVRRLSDLMTHGTLRPALYPPERRSPRLARVLQALDMSLAGASHRDIGIALFGEDRIERDWHHPHNYLRDHVRRAIAYGRDLMEGGYRRLLS